VVIGKLPPGVQGEQKAPFLRPSNKQQYNSKGQQSNALWDRGHFPGVSIFLFYNLSRFNFVKVSFLMQLFVIS